MLDVAPKLAAKARLLSDGDTNKNDPNDAKSVAVAGLRSTKVRPAVREDYSAVMGMWSDRYLELAGARTQVVCRLHALLCELLPGGFAGVLRANAAQKVLEAIDADSPADHARLALAWQLLGDLRRIDEQRRETKKHMTLAVKGSATTLTESTGSARSWPAQLKAMSVTSAASPLGPRLPPATAPHRSRCPRERRRSTGCRGEATAGSTTPSTWLRSPNSKEPTAPVGPTTSANEQKERRAKRPSGA